MAREPSIEVELVEAGAGAPGPVPAGTPDAPVAPARRRRVRPRTLVAAGLVLVTGLVGTQALLDARERALYARFADVRGVVAPLRPDLEVLWRGGAAETGLLWAGEEVDGLHVGGWFDETGTPTAGGVDARTGEPGWSVPLAEAEPAVAGPEDRPWMACDVTVGDSPVLVCLVPSEHAPAGVPGESELEGDVPLAAGRIELVAVDVSSGTVLRRAPEEVGTGMAVLGDLVVTARTAPDESVVVHARDARSGDEAWTYTSPPGTAAGSASAPGPRSPGLAEVDGAMVVETGAGGFRLGASGSLEVAYPPGPGAGEGEALTLVRARHVVRHARGGGGTELLGDDGTRTPLPGYPIQVQVDDGSVPELLLVRGELGGVEAVDAGTGRTRWSRPDLVLHDGVVLDGTLHLVTTTAHVLALDLSDGTTRWSTEDGSGAARTGALPSATLVTDGRVLGVAGQRTSGSSPELQAFAVDDGRLLWTAELPAGVEGIHAVGGQLLGWDTGSEEYEAVVLG